MTKDSFDYVIVGAGPAGCVLANRLSADPGTSVCLLEAGPEDKSFLIKLPAGIVALMWDPRHNWKYYSEPEPHLNNRSLYCPRGKVLGGSTSINAMCFTRGAADDFNRWAESGATGWAWADLLPHYIATEQQQRPDMNPSQHGYAGEQMVTDTHDTVDQLSLDFIEAVAESGVAPKNNDFSGDQLEGAGLYQTFQNGKGQRCSAAHAFLHPVRDRPNLTVITRAMVEKVLFDGKTAIGVECKVKRTLRQIKANKEVILSGGSINTPQLLMLSGVGAQEELAIHNIKTVLDLPGVGKNLQDHLDVILNTRVKRWKGVGISIPGIFKVAMDSIRYLTSRKGFLTSNGAEAGGFFKTDPSLKIPDVQMHFAPLLLESHAIRTVGHGHCLHLCNLQPKSRGSVTLKSARPQDKPAIRFNYCEHPDDMDILVKAVKIGRKIIAAPSLNKSTKREHTPGINVQTDEEIKEFIRNKAETIYHPVGTCKMGTDALSVVDNELRVHGIKNLRVVDASIMPNINSGNTQATVIAIANKAATHILKQPTHAPQKAQPVVSA